MRKYIFSRVPRIAFALSRRGERAKSELKHGSKLGYRSGSRSPCQCFGDHWRICIRVVLARKGLWFRMAPNLVLLDDGFISGRHDKHVQARPAEKCKPEGSLCFHVCDGHALAVSKCFSYKVIEEAVSNLSVFRASILVETIYVISGCTFC